MTARHLSTRRQAAVWLVGWLLLSVLVVALDQWSKSAVLGAFSLGERLIVTPFFNLTLAYNRGAAFSFLATAGGWQHVFFIGLALLVSCWLLWMLCRHALQKRFSLALSLILGGALGNVIDRLIHGAVVDFIQLHAGGYYYPTFNLADSAITCGAFLLIVDSFWPRKVEKA